jgi:hypothetical protein
VKGEDSRVRSRKRRPQVRRAGLVAAAMAGLALPIAACSGGSGSGSGRLSGAGDTAYQKAVGFAQCMRSHGEPGFPDPDSHGVFTFHGNPFAGAAYKACRHQLPDGGQATVAQQQKALGQALKFAACVRSHGLPNSRTPPCGATRSSLAALALSTHRSSGRRSGHAGSFRSVFQGRERLSEGPSSGRWLAARVLRCPGWEWCWHRDARVPPPR